MIFSAEGVVLDVVGALRDWHISANYDGFTTRRGTAKSYIAATVATGTTDAIMRRQRFHRFNACRRNPDNNLKISCFKNFETVGKYSRATVACKTDFCGRAGDSHRRNLPFALRSSVTKR